MKARSFDYILVIIVLALVLFGLVMVFSASYYTSQKSGGTGQFFFQKQLIGAGLGFAAMILFSLIDYHIYEKKFVMYLMVAVSTFFLILVFFTKEDINGAKRWIDLGFISFQPSEVARFSLLVLASGVFTENFKLIRAPKLRLFIRGSWQVIAVLVLYCGLIFFEPNLSMTLSILLMVICLFFAAGVSFRVLTYAGLGAAAVGAAGILDEPWRVQRLMIFSNPWKDPTDTGYQLIQSLYALGSGGLTGVGLGNSKQKYLYLTYGESDFILSIIGEELGFIGIMVLLFIFIILIWRGLMIAIKAKDMFGMMLASGIVSIIGIQTIIHIAVVTSSMPPTGVPLPFVSYGSTSLVVFMSSIGILLNISRSNVKIV